MSDTEACTICQLRNQRSSEGTTGHSYRIQCARCGEYEWDYNLSPSGRAARVVQMAGFVREQNAAGIVPTFTSELVEMVQHRPRPLLRDRAMRLLVSLYETVGQRLKRNISFSLDQKFLAVSYSADFAELSILLDFLCKQNFVHLLPNNDGRITTEGCIAAEELLQPRSVSAQGFVAMSFHRSLDEAYTLGFDPGIRKAGYRPLRIDGHEHAGPISDAIMAEIRRSRFVVADYTRMNNGVYFEAGFAMGLGVPTIGTCHAEDFSRLHFDIRHINTLKWETPADLAEKLARRISAVIGDGPLRESQ